LAYGEEGSRAGFVRKTVVGRGEKDRHSWRFGGEGLALAFKQRARGGHDEGRRVGIRIAHNAYNARKQRMTRFRHQPDPITVTLTFQTTTEGAELRWESHVLGVRTSQFRTPFRGETLTVISRVLDVLQDPYYPTPYTLEQQRLFHFSPDEQQRLSELELWDSAGYVRVDAPRRIGRALLGAVCADPIGAQAFGTVRDHAVAVGRMLALCLRFAPDAVELASLPWELLWDESQTPLLLSQGSGAICVRHLDLAQALPPARAHGGPLRILALAPHAGIPSELRQIEREARMAIWQPLVAAGRAEVTELSPVTRSTLVQALRDNPPDIVHYYGHGRYQNGVGALLLDGAELPEAWTDAAALATLLGSVGLVVLHACQGAMANSGSLLSGVAPMLSAAGIPAVVAMQYSVRCEAALRMSSTIYKALAEGRSVQEAVAHARQTMFVEEDDRMSWFVPVLYLRTRDIGPVYLRTPIEAPLLLNPFPHAIEFAPVPLHPSNDERTHTRQSIVARAKGMIRAISMRGTSGSAQVVAAELGGYVGVVRLQADNPTEQRVLASSEAVIEQVELRDSV
jgi:hypothetical protein